MTAHDDIRIGTLIKVGPETVGYLKQIVPHGFESFQIVFGRQIDTHRIYLATGFTPNG